MIKKFERYVESVDFPKSYSDIASVCKKYDIKGYSINTERVVDVYDNPNKAYKIVNGGIMLNQKNLNSIPIRFGFVDGYFSCYDNNLKSLEGCPEYVGGMFSCAFNKLTTLEFCPEYVGGGFFCHKNNLISLEGAPFNIEGNFDCSDNCLTTLKGSPEYVSGEFICSSNNLYTLDGAPREMFSFSISSYKNHNPVEEILDIFPSYRILDIVKLWDTFDPVKKKDNNWYVREIRLREFYLEITGDKYDKDFLNFEKYKVCED
jgi:hypothetical protein